MCIIYEKLELAANPIYLPSGLSPFGTMLNFDGTGNGDGDGDGTCKQTLDCLHSISPYDQNCLQTQQK